MTTTRALLYVRVSTAEQAASGLGLDAQESTLRAEAERRGWDVVGVHREEGASGKDMARPELQAALSGLVAGSADVLVVSKLDRLTRSLPHLCDLLDWAGRHGVALVALDLGLDMTTSTGKLVAQVMGAVAEWERVRIGERTREAAAASRAQGKQWGGLVGVATKAPEVAARIARERSSGATWQSIADGLNADGVPTARGGAEWRVSSVQTAAGYRRPPTKQKKADLPEPSKRRRRVAS
ncbi:MAG: Resolvase, N-terminal domain [Frankiales bacterium]|nr:Resolvase, N-terminal domain [Frankiales bacterium]